VSRRSFRDEQLARVVDQLRRGLQAAAEGARREEDDPLARDGAYGHAYAYGYLAATVRNALAALDAVRADGTKRAA
jgi:hypothetical protein